MSIAPFEQNRSVRTLLISPLIAGGLLLMLLPVGLWLGVTGVTYSTLFILHLSVLLVAVGGSVRYLWTICRESRLSQIIGICSFLIFIALICGALHPVTARDALIHHLAVPKLWIEAGAITKIPWHEWSFYPMLLQLGFTAILQVAPPEATALYHLVYIFLAAALCAFICEEVLHKKLLAVIAFFITLTLPIQMSLGMTPLVDGGVTYFSMLVLAWMIYAAPRTGYGGLIGIGVALGLALGVKYNVIPFALFALLVYPVLRLRYISDRIEVMRECVIIGGIALIVFTPWIFKNLAWAGNPVYPLYQSWFSADSKTPKAFAPSLTPIEQRTLLYGEHWVDMALTPLRMVLMGKEGDPRRYDGVLSPVLLFAIFIFFRPIRKAPWVAPCALLIVSYYLFSLLSTSWRIRYLAPIFPPLLLCSIAGVQVAAQRLRGKLIPTVALVALCHGIAATGYLVSVLYKNDTFTYLFTSMTREHYLMRHLSEYKIVSTVNERLPSTARAYLLGTSNQFFYYSIGVFSGGYYSELALVDWVKNAKSEDAIYAAFTQRGITHLIVQRERALNALENHFTDFDKNRWNLFEQRYLTPLFSVGGYAVWKVGT
jgi:hypothetical protein